MGDINWRQVAVIFLDCYAATTCWFVAIGMPIWVAFDEGGYRAPAEFEVSNVMPLIALAWAGVRCISPLSKQANEWARP